MLTLAASDDTQAFAFHVPVRALVWLYRILLPRRAASAPACSPPPSRASWACASACTAQESERVVAMRRNAQGGFDDEEAQPA